MTVFAQPPPVAAHPRDLLELSTEWMSSSVVRIRAVGDIDASNAHRLPEYVFGRSANCLRLILDLSEVGFFSTAGLTTLFTIDERCARANVNWMLVPSDAVSRLVDLCDPEGKLPVARS